MGSQQLLAVAAPQQELPPDFTRKAASPYFCLTTSFTSTAWVFGKTFSVSKRPASVLRRPASVLRRTASILGSAASDLGRARLSAVPPSVTEDAGFSP